jgi:HEAT repeat protein
MPDEFAQMVASYMEAGFLENIIALLRKERAFYLLGSLIADERPRVRIGAVALAEELLSAHREEMLREVPGIARALRSGNPTIRADALYLLSLLGGEEARAYIRGRLSDPHPAVRQAAEEALRELQERKNCW